MARLFPQAIAQFRELVLNRLVRRFSDSFYVAKRNDVMSGKVRVPKPFVHGLNGRGFEVLGQHYIYYANDSQDFLADVLSAINRAIQSAKSSVSDSNNTTKK